MLNPLRCLIAALALAACASEPGPQPQREPLVLTGTITRVDHQTYREIPFTVPPGTQRITIDFTYDKENRTIIDLGLRDPDGQRGWSGGNKTRFEIGQFDATPSYRAAPIQPGEWKLVLGVPNIRDGVTARYTATITLSGKKDADRRVVWASSHPGSWPAGWFRGDFHTHTAHSDGSCGVEQARMPCPAERTFDAARNAGLDFVVITDHNTITQIDDITALQGKHLRPLLIPGTEITTFNGHANVVGNTDFLDFQLGSPRLPTLEKLFDQVDAANAFISVNHPSLPSGEACMGCSWTVKDTDWSRVTAIEVINGASMRTSGPEGAFNGIAFWDKLLRDGHRITAIAGSDNHDATDTTGAKQSPVGTPATVVYAGEFSTPGIIAGVKSGRVFIDVANAPGAVLDANAVGNGGQVVRMGGEIRVADGAAVMLTASLVDPPVGSDVRWVTDSVIVGPPKRLSPLPRPPQPVLFDARLAPGAAHGYARPELRDASGKLLLLGNPIYFRLAG